MDGMDDWEEWIYDRQMQRAARGDPHWQAEQDPKRFLDDVAQEQFDVEYESTDIRTEGVRYADGPLGFVRIRPELQQGLRAYLKVEEQSSGRHVLATLADVVRKYRTSRLIVQEAYNAWATYDLSDDPGERQLYWKVYEKFVPAMRRFGETLPRREKMEYR